METAEISAYVHKFESYTDVYKEMRVKQVNVGLEESSGSCKFGRKCIYWRTCSPNVVLGLRCSKNAGLILKSQFNRSKVESGCWDTGSVSCRDPVSPPTGNTECRLQSTLDVNGVRCW